MRTDLSVMFVFLSCVLLFSGCTTVSTGKKPPGAMDEGQLYEDPSQRFTVIVPDSRNLVPKEQKRRRCLHWQTT
jgi:hypothetical protein